jgi:hypothetical protein
VFWSDRAKDAELLVLRHENAVLRRNAGRVRYEPGDRMWFAAVARLPPRKSWAAIFPVAPATLLAWHRRLAAGKYDTSKRRKPVGADYSSVLVRGVDENLGTHRRAGGAIRLQAQQRFSGWREADRRPFGRTQPGLCPRASPQPGLAGGRTGGRAAWRRRLARPPQETAASVKRSVRGRSR